MMKTSIPSWLKSRMSAQGCEAIEAAVREVEKKTSGEIVPVIVRRSSTVGHVHFALFLTLLVAYLLFGFSHWIEENFLENHWLTVLFAFLAFVFSRFLAEVEFFERWLTPKADQQKQVLQRAELEFYESRIKKTASGTGILLYLSLMERQAVVLADEGIARFYSQETWQEVISLMVQGIKDKDVSAGMVSGVNRCGELLSKHLPITNGDKNELPNHLVIKED